MAPPIVCSDGLDPETGQMVEHSQMLDVLRAGVMSTAEEGSTYEQVVLHARSANADLVCHDRLYHGLSCRMTFVPDGVWKCCVWLPLAEVHDRRQRQCMLSGGSTSAGARAFRESVGDIVVPSLGPGAARVQVFLKLPRGEAALSDAKPHGVFFTLAFKEEQCKLLALALSKCLVSSRLSWPVLCLTDQYEAALAGDMEAMWRLRQSHDLRQVYDHIVANALLLAAQRGESLVCAEILLMMQPKPDSHVVQDAMAFAEAAGHADMECWPDVDNAGGRLCPITQTVMRYPVTIAGDVGRTVFERVAITQWLLLHSTVPSTNPKLPSPAQRELVAWTGQ